jgi:hypothetical protein
VVVVVEMQNGVYCVSVRQPCLGANKCPCIRTGDGVRVHSHRRPHATRQAIINDNGTFRRDGLVAVAVVDDKFFCTIPRCASHEVSYFKTIPCPVR